MTRENDITIIVGRKGCGKSSRAKEIARERPRRIYMDAMHEYTDGVIVRDFASLAAYLRDKAHSRYSVVFRSLDEREILAALAIATYGSPEAPPLPGVTY